VSGRDKNPGDRGSSGDLRDYQQYLGKPERCRLGPPNPETGVVKAIGDTIMDARDVTVPVLWFSANGRQSAWGRYMPMGNEHCHIGYRKDGTAYFLNYDATATKNDRAGWTELTAAQKAGVTGFQTFKTLKRGEFDFKSSGNAYIFGSNTGTLLLSGGQAFIKLDNQAYRIESKAAEFHQTAISSQVRFGSVFRKLLPADMAESQVPGGFSEFMVDLNDSTLNPTNPLTGWPTNPLLSKAKVYFGDIFMPVSPPMPMMGLTVPGPLRGLISLGNAASVESFRLEVDQLGNAAWTQLGPLGLNMTLPMFNATVATKATITAAAITLAGVKISIGSELAIEPLVLGNQLIAALVALIGVFTANAATFGDLNNIPVKMNTVLAGALAGWLSVYGTPAAPFVSKRIFTEL
jgi:hypothetical protein